MTELKSASAIESAIKSSPRVVIDFYTRWCGACKSIAPKYDKLSKTTHGVKFYKVEAEKVSGIDKYNIESIPTFIYFVKGKVSKTIVADFDRLKSTLKKDEGYYY